MIMLRSKHYFKHFLVKKTNTTSGQTLNNQTAKFVTQMYLGPQGYDLIVS